ncbi:MAG: hypothetical protein FJ053_04110 [Cyanobacteria bacterium M_surface_10_m1_298]|nr:hypothetical protein [Cyanobacteria bacterium M_surface_10_m1_298]
MASLNDPALRLDPATARSALAALLGVAQFCAGGPEIDPAERLTIEAIRDHLAHQPDLDLDGLSPLTPEALAEQVSDPIWRERILRGMTVVALMDGQLSEERLSYLRRAARSLGVGEVVVNTYANLVHERMALVRLDMARRGFLVGAVRDFLGRGRLEAAMQLARYVLKQSDPALAARYRALGDLPEGTLGHAYIQFIESNGFSVPGEPGGPPPPIARHDCMHVLGGYGTSPAEEGGVAGLQAGMSRSSDPFFSILLVLAEFQLGRSVVPIETGQHQHDLDPAVLFQGLERGLQMNRNLIGDWDLFADAAVPLEELRLRYGIPPR